MSLGLTRGLAFLAILVLALIPAAAQAPSPSPESIGTIEVQARPIDSFDLRNSARRQFGALTFRGGLVLDSPARNFGGFSALRVEPDGQHFVAASDRGRWLRGRIVYRGEAPVAIADAEMGPMLGPDGRPLRSRGWYDTEALTGDGGVLYVGIERVNRIVRFDYGRDGLRARGQPVAVPPAMRTLPHNKSIECLAVVPKGLPQKGVPPRGGPAAGTLISVAERGLDAKGDLQGFLIGGAGGTFALRRTDDFDVSDCTVAPDGRFLVLERRFSWTRGLAMRIRSVPLADIRPGALVDGRELIAADMGDQIDNMEGLSAHRAADGALVLTLISDDNFLLFQRTLLLQFTLPDEQEAE